MILKGARICAEHALYEQGAVEITGKQISNIFLDEAGLDFTNQRVLALPEDWLIFPGMIDIHLHGGYGVDFMECDQAGLVKISQMLPREGVCAYLVTTMTQSAQAIANSIEVAAQYYRDQSGGKGGAELLGINLEGPFIASEKSCAQPLACILSPNLEVLREWNSLSQGSLRIITLAPELAGSGVLIDYAQDHNIVVALGHSGATYEDTEQAIARGCLHATHLFNAMAPIHHRYPGAAVALLLDDQVSVELIVDGVHLHPAMIRWALRTKGVDKVILITDAMSAKGTDGRGDYRLAGQKVTVRGTNVFLAGEVLAGSVLTMDVVLRNILKFTGCSLLDASKLLSQNPAKLLNSYATKGSITIGKDADLVVFDQHLRVRLTICRGEVVYENLVDGVEC